MNVTSKTSTSDDVVLFCNTIDNIEEVLFVRLTKFEKNSSITVESKKRRQVKGSDVLFLLLKKQLHMIQIKDRLTEREINNMYTGKKIVFAVNPNLKEDLGENQGFLAIVKYMGNTRIAICFRHIQYGNVFFVLNNNGDYEDLKHSYITMEFIVNKCDMVIQGDVVDEQRRITNGYFVNEVYRYDKGDKEMQSDENLYISWLSPDKLTLSVGVQFSEIIKKKQLYNVVYVPDYAINTLKSRADDNLFSIPIKRDVIPNAW